MNSFVLKVDSKLDLYLPNFAYMGQYDDWHAYELLGDLADYPELAGAQVLGSWDMAGRKQAAIHPDFHKIRPLGNYVPRGDATDILQAQHFDGWAIRQLGDGQIYPEENDPFTIEIRPRVFREFGYGWRAEMHGAAASRDAGVRGMAWYSDPECTQYAGSTDAFRKGPSEWQKDEEGNPLEVWFTETPENAVRSLHEPWYLALLWGSIQEGCVALEIGMESVTRMYWKQTQGAEAKADAWLKIPEDEILIDPRTKKFRLKGGNWTSLKTLARKGLPGERMTEIKRLARIFGML